MKNKILQVSCNGLTNGGVQQVIMSIVRNLSDEYQFDILTFTKGKEYYDDEFCTYGGKIFRSPHKDKINGKEVDFYYRGLRIYKDTLRILKQNGPYYAIHCHNYFESVFCLLAAKKADVKIRIVHSHNDLSNVPYSSLRKTLQNQYRKGINKLATLKVGCSRNACDFLYGDNGISQVINNAIDVERFRNLSGADDKQLKQGLRILHVGNFSVQKNQMFLIELASELKKTLNNFHMTLVGGHSAYQDMVENKIIEMNLSNEVTILPQNSDIPMEMNNANLFVFPSKYEGLGIVLIEAQAAGLHCVVSKAIPPEADLGNIEYLETFDAELWAKRIEKIWENGLSRKYVDMDTYEIKNVKELYRRIYRGN